MIVANNINFQTTVVNNEHHEQETFALDIQTAAKKISSSRKQVKHEANSKKTHRTLEIR